jgi:hypothetical protein
MSGLLSNFRPSKARRGSSLFDGICLHGTWFDAVQDGVVPIGINARDFALRIKTQEIGVGYEYDLCLLCDARDIRWYRPAHQSLDDGAVSFSEHLDYFDAEIGDGLRKGAPDAVKAAPNRTSVRLGARANVSYWPIADATLSDSRGSFWGKSGDPSLTRSRQLMMLWTAPPYDIELL